jgi:thiosulfate/3-mercaptopyruvate sulfurtransferase
MNAGTKFFAAVFLAAALAFGLHAEENPAKLAGADWLSGKLMDPGIRIIDMRADIREYWEAHIPGAVYLDSESLRWPDKGVPGKLMPPDALGRLLGEMGIDRKTTVVVYSEVNHYRAAYFAWALDYLKHPSWVILENGFASWKRRGLPVTQDYPKIKPARYDFGGATDPSVRASIGEVKSRDRARTALLDVRPAELYSGEKGAWKRRGHIPGAIHHSWADDVNTDGTWKDAESLEKAYAGLGVTRDKTIIVSCGQGQMSSHTYFTLKYVLGFPRVRNYDGSFNEWSNDDALPVETNKR